jgi:hypothetical protein
VAGAADERSLRGLSTHTPGGAGVYYAGHRSPMDLALGIVLIVVTAAGALFVLGLFVWGAIKDGQANDAVQARIHRRSWPR